MDNSLNSNLEDTAAMAADTGAYAAEQAAQGAERIIDAGQSAAQKGADAMREGAERAGAQAEQTAQRTAAGLQTVAAEWIESTRTLAERTVERMAAVAQARNVVDLMGAQRDLIVGSFQDMLAAQHRLGAASISAMTDATRRAPSALAA